MCLIVWVKILEKVPVGEGEGKFGKKAEKDTVYELKITKKLEGTLVQLLILRNL